VARDEYKHIVDNYFRDPEPCVALLLNETQTKIYKKREIDGVQSMHPTKRVPWKTFDGHMILNETTIDFIKKNVGKYQSFERLYFDAVEKYNEMSRECAKVNLDGVETFGLGEWLRFPSKISDEQNFNSNAQKLAALVKDTPWCTKTLAAEQLAHGDFYVFNGLDKNPHLAVKTTGAQIDEVRGIAGGQNQEIEPEYLAVAESFLNNNKKLRDGKEWFDEIQSKIIITECLDMVKNKKIQVADILPVLRGETEPTPEIRRMFDAMTAKSFRAHGESSARDQLFPFYAPAAKTFMKNENAKMFKSNDYRAVHREQEYQKSMSKLLTLAADLERYEKMLGDGSITEKDYFGLADTISLFMVESPNIAGMEKVFRPLVARHTGFTEDKIYVGGINSEMIWSYPRVIVGNLNRESMDMGNSTLHAVEMVFGNVDLSHCIRGRSKDNFYSNIAVVGGHLNITKGNEGLRHPTQPIELSNLRFVGKEFKTRDTIISAAPKLEYVNGEMRKPKLKSAALAAPAGLRTNGETEIGE
jgi:hypothetical protein